MGVMKEKKSEQLRKILNERLRQQGWDSITAFVRGSGIHLSLETVRRAFTDCRYKGLETMSLVSVLGKLGYSPNEIKEMIRKYTADTEVWPLLGSYQVEFSVDEMALIDAYREILSADPNMAKTIADQIDLVGKLAGVDTSYKTDAIRVVG